MKNKLAIPAALAGITATAVAVAADPDYTTRERARVLADTNTTTTVTAYTAAGAGQLLAGRVASSNAVWVATAAGTNYWVKIAQTAP